MVLAVGVEGPVRMYMNSAEWQAHKDALTPAAPPEARLKKVAMFAKVELRLKSYQKTLIDKMCEMAGDDAPDAMEKDPTKHTTNCRPTRSRSEPPS